MLTVTKINSTIQFHELEDIWDKLLIESNYHNIFLSFTWMKIWWDNFCNNKQLYILIVKSNDNIVGIAPLMKTQFSNKNTIEFIGANSSDYMDFIISENHEQVINKIFEYIDSHKCDWDILQLNQISENSNSIKIINQLFKKRKWLYNIDSTEVCPEYVYDGDEKDRLTYKIKKSKSLKNQINFFKKKGGLELIEINDTKQILGFISTFFHFHITRWSGTNTPSKFLDSQMRHFYTDLILKLHPKNNIHFILLKHEDIPIAFFFSFKYDKILYLYTPSFNKYYSDKSPGKILNHMLIELLVQQGYDKIDFLRGDENYKNKFCNRTHKNYLLTVYKKKNDYIKKMLRNAVRQNTLIRKIFNHNFLKNAKTKIVLYKMSHSSLELVTAIIRTISRQIYNYSELIMFEYLDDKNIISTRSDDNVEIKKVGIKEIDHICTFIGITPSSRKYQVIIERLNNGCECFIAIKDNAIASIFWGVFKKEYFREIKKDYHLKDNEVILTDAYTSPVFRGQGIYQILTRKMIAYYKEKNFKILIACFSTNHISLKAIRNVGFSKIKIIRTFSLLKVKIF